MIRARRYGLRRVIGGVTLVLAVLFAGPWAAAAQGPGVVDFCAGVDHPPFERDYDVEGASNFNLAVSTSAAMTGTFVLTLGADTAEQPFSLEGPGVAEESFPIFAFGRYDWMIVRDGGTILEQGSLDVGPAEEPCWSDGLALASAEPSATPSPSPSSTPEPQSPSPSVPVETSAPTTAPSASEEPVIAPGLASTGGFEFPWLALIVVGLLLALAGALIMFLGIDFSGEVSCPDECDTLGAKRNCTLSAFGVSSQLRTPGNDAGIGTALTMMKYAPLPGMGTGLPMPIGMTVVTGTPPPVPLPATASGAAREPTIDLTKALQSFLNNRFPTVWIKIDYQECSTAHCFPQVWRTYRSWVGKTSAWTQVREATPTVSDPLGMFPQVSDWTNVNTMRAINQAIVDTINTMGCQ